GRHRRAARYHPPPGRMLRRDGGLARMPTAPWSADAPPELGRYAPCSSIGTRRKGMRKGLSVGVVMLVLALGLVVAGCGGSDESASGDLLASIKDKGVLTVSTDPAYPPASKLNKDTGEY